MDEIGGFKPTGRVFHGPAADLVELVDEDDLRHTAIVFRSEYSDHPAINSALEVVLGFVESPMVTGLVEMVHYDFAISAFVYPTGQAYSVGEVIRTHADMGKVAGVRAGLEFMFAAGEILVEGAEAGELQGIYSHGGLTPWRTLIKPDGQAQVIGYALPQVEILQFHEDPKLIPSEDSFRYCPPERIEALGEDLSSDLFGLALIAFELMTGKPMYDGLVNDIRAQAGRAEASRRLYRFKDKLPQAVQDVLKGALRREPEDRFEEGGVFLDNVRSALGRRDVSGPPLMDVMEEMGNVQSRVGVELEAGATMAVSRDQLRAMAEAEIAAEEAAEDAERRSKFEAPSRKRRAAPSTRGRKGGEAPEADPEETAEPVSEEPAEAAAAPEEADARWGSPGRRRSPRRRSAAADEAPSETSAEDLMASLRTSQDGDTSRRRGPSRKSDIASMLRDSADPVESAPAEDPPEAAEASEPDAPAGEIAGPPRRRPRRPKSKPVEETAPAEASPAEPDANEAAPGASSRVSRPPPRMRRPPRRRGKGAEEGAPSVPASEVATMEIDSEAAKLEAQLMAELEATSAAEAKAAEEALAAEAKAAEEAIAAELAAAAAAEAKAAEETIAAELAAAAAAEAKAAEEALAAEAKAAEEAIAAELAAAAAAEAKAAEEALAVEAAAALEAAAAAEADDEEGESTVMFTRPRRPRRPPKPKSAPEPEPKPKAAPAPEPAPTPAAESTGGLSLKVALGAAAARAVSVESNLSVGEVVARLTGSFAPLPIDAMGQLEGWYRMLVDGERVAPSTLASSLKSGAKLSLERVENDSVRVNVDVQDEDQGTQMRTTVGKAIPVGSLLVALLDWLELEGDDWKLWLGDRCLAPYEILADCELPRRVVLVVKKG